MAFFRLFLLSSRTNLQKGSSQNFQSPILSPRQKRKPAQKKDLKKGKRFPIKTFMNSLSIQKSFGKLGRKKATSFLVIPTHFVRDFLPGTTIVACIVRPTHYDSQVNTQPLACRPHAASLQRVVFRFRPHVPDPTPKSASPFPTSGPLKPCQWRRFRGAF